jgi:hypothetical protein
MASAKANSGRQDDPNSGKPDSQAKLARGLKPLQKHTKHLKDYLKSFLEEYPNSRLVMMPVAALPGRAALLLSQHVQPFKGD